MSDGLLPYYFPHGVFFWPRINKQKKNSVVG